MLLHTYTCMAVLYTLDLTYMYAQSIIHVYIYMDPKRVSVLYSCISPLFPGLPYEHCLLVYRYFFPALLAVLLVSALVTLTVKQVNKLYEKVKNEKYVVCRTLCISITPSCPVQIHPPSLIVKFLGCSALPLLIMYI